MPAICLLIAFLAALHIETGEAWKQKMNLCFLIDGSSTVCDGNATCENWKSVLNFSKAVSKTLNVGPTSDQVAMATYFNKTGVNWDLRKYTAITPLLSAIDAVPYYGGEFYDLPSADAAISQVFSRKYTNKRHCKNVVLMITDGVPNVDETNAAAIADLWQKKGITMFVICVTPRCTEDWAKAAAAKPKKDGLKTYFNVGSYSSLKNIMGEVLEQICYFLSSSH